MVTSDMPDTTLIQGDFFRSISTIQMSIKDGNFICEQNDQNIIFLQTKVFLQVDSVEKQSGPNLIKNKSR